MEQISIPGYRILGKIAEGGVYAVYKAARMPHEEVVAVKVVHARLARDAATIKMIRREAKICVALKHPNIIATTKAMLDLPRPTLEMEFFPSQTLKFLMNKGPLPLDRAIAIAGKVADALAYLHNQGVIHKDIKPENMLIGKGWDVRLIDFSLAQTLSEIKWHKFLPFLADKRVQGTLSYLSPEQIRSMPLDPRTDIYSLGVAYYELFCGRLPFAATDQKGLIEAHLKRAPENPRRVNPELPRELEKLILSMMAKEPDQRIQTMFLVRNALSKLDGR